MRPERGRVLSVFLNLDPAEFASGGARSTAINSVLNEADREIENLADVEHDELIALREDLDRVRSELERSDLAVDGTQGLAIYACGAAGLFEVVRLPRPVETHAVVQPTASIQPLIRTGHERHWCVLLANRRTARIFHGPASALQEVEHIEDDVHSQHDQGGWSQARFGRGVEKEKDDHLKHAADVVFDAHKRHGFDAVLLGCPDELTGSLESALHPYLRERIGGHLNIDVENTTPDDVQRVAGEAILQHEQEYQRQLLERLDENLGRNTRAASGLRDVISAINEARVEVLLIREGLQEPGARDPNTEMLAHRSAIGADGADLEPVDDVIEYCLHKAVEQSAEIVVLRDPQDLEEHGGIAALLRF